MNSSDDVRDIPDYVRNALNFAYTQALLAYENNEVPVGAVIVKNQVIICSDHNRIVERQDPTAHAEMLVIQQAANIVGNERLTDCELFTTLEPCTMCSGAILMARIPAVYFIANDEKLPGLRSVLNLPGHNHIPEVRRIDLSDLPSGELLKNFFKNKREQKSALNIQEI